MHSLSSPALRCTIVNASKFTSPGINSQHTERATALSPTLLNASSAVTIRLHTGRYTAFRELLAFSLARPARSPIALATLCSMRSIWSLTPLVVEGILSSNRVKVESNNAIDISAAFGVSLKLIGADSLSRKLPKKDRNRFAIVDLRVPVLPTKYRIKRGSHPISRSIAFNGVKKL